MTHAEAVEVVVCDLADLAVEEGRTYVVADEQVALFRMRDGSVHAVGAACPHRGGPIADGQCDEQVVWCPLHAFGFDLATGACVNGDLQLPRWDARVDDGRVVVTIPA
ncbi:Rieske (2Fe-2S) protein [Propioniciclava sinopodophylli]|uniref:Rieske (2Fe-2S) protein n=1 Tax=Propioniciclava sinopodophylli TaxID=1837344 RepID=UPI002492DB59|nr:Rieske (2Fe-2S) protein [Propioniciclava sinopodophylli]